MEIVFKVHQIVKPYVAKYLLNMDKSWIKFLVFFGFLQQLLPTLADDDCISSPEILKEVVDQCSQLITEEDLELSRGEEADDGRLKDYSLCFYEGLGWYQDGAFDLEFIQQFLEKSHPDQELMHQIYKFAKVHLEQANAIEGNDSDRAHAYFVTTFLEESQQLLRNVWCHG